MARTSTASIPSAKPSGEKIGADLGYEINIYDTNENPDNRTGAIIRFSPPMAEVIAGGK